MVHIYATMLSVAAAEFRIDLFDVCLCLILCANTFVHMREAHNMNLYMNIHGAYVADNYAQELACVRARVRCKRVCLFMRVRVLAQN